MKGSENKTTGLAVCAYTQTPYQLKMQKTLILFKGLVSKCHFDKIALLVHC